MDVVVIYTMGRVGSNYIANSIHKKNTEVLVTHSLNREHSLDGLKREPTSKISKRIERISELKSKGRKILIISAVRNPFIRAFSAYCFFYKRWNCKINGTGKQIKNHFLENFNYRWALNFFDNEIKLNFNIDIYNYNFLNPCSVINKDNYTLLLIRTDHLQYLRPALESLGVSTKNAQSRNKAKSKSQGAYLKLKKQKFPKNFVDEICEAKLTTHFFSQKEISDMRNRWCE